MNNVNSGQGAHPSAHSYTFIPIHMHILILVLHVYYIHRSSVCVFCVVVVVSKHVDRASQARAVRAFLAPHNTAKQRALIA